MTEDEQRSQQWDALFDSTPTPELEWEGNDTAGWDATHTLESGEKLTIRVWPETNPQRVTFIHYKITGRPGSRNHAWGANSGSIEKQKESAAYMIKLLITNEIYLGSCGDSNH